MENKFTKDNNNLKIPLPTKLHNYIEAHPMAMGLSKWREHVLINEHKY
jgi:hypothetical protein